MTKYSELVACLIVGLVSSALSACSSSDGGSISDPAAACKQLVQAECTKFYECFTDAERASITDKVGTSEGDCETKMEAANCSPADVVCETGTYRGDKASQCLNAVDSLSCTDFKGLGTTTSFPAACNAVCS